MFVDRLLNYLPPSYQHYATYPGVIERVELAFDNAPSLIALFVIILLYWLRPAFFRHRFFKFVLMGLVFVPGIIRFLGDYAYDTPLGLVSQLVDIGILLFIFYEFGFRFFRLEYIFLNITVGLAGFTLAFLFLTLVRANWLINLPFAITPLLISTWAAWRIYYIDFPKITTQTIVTAFVIMLPFLPYAFTPAPPDADITTMAEIIGYYFQGQSLFHVVSGIPGEWFSIRYPAGLPAIGWGIGHLLNVRASEALLLVWYFAFVLLILNLIILSRFFKLNPYIVLFFSLNLTITGSLGLHGGQVQEMLSYALGISMISLMLQNRITPGAVCLGSSIVIQPIVAIPFLITFSINCGWLWIRRSLNLARLKWSFFIIIFTIGYLGVISIGKSLTPSQPNILLSELTWAIFFNNIQRYLTCDTFGLYLFLVSLLIAIWFYKNEYRQYGILIIWFLGALLIDGLFGHTKWGARFQADFSTIGLWILSVALTYKLLLSLFQSKCYRNGLLIGCFCIWMLYLRPGFPLKPVSVFTTHSDVRMGRYIEKKLPQNSLVANIRIDKCGHVSPFSFLRGNSGVNTVFARIGNHQIKNGNLVPFDITKCFCNNDISKGCLFSSEGKSLSLPQNILACFARKQVTHVFIAARPEIADFINLIGHSPLKQIGQTYLFDTQKICINNSK